MVYWHVESSDNEYVRRAAMYWNAYRHAFLVGSASSEYLDKLLNNYTFWFIAATCGIDYARENFS